MTPSQKKQVKSPKKPSLNSHKKTLKKPLKNCQKTLQISTKNPHKNPQEKRKVISFRKNIKINFDIAMRKGGIHSSGVKYYFFFKRDWKSIKVANFF
jgi:hypothetical protein